MNTGRVCTTDDVREDVDDGGVAAEMTTARLDPWLVESAGYTDVGQFHLVFAHCIPRLCGVGIRRTGNGDWCVDHPERATPEECERMIAEAKRVYEATADTLFSARVERAAAPDARGE